MTYSIAARCPVTGDLGVAIQSHWFNVGRETVWGLAGGGVIATQAFIDPHYGERGLRLLKRGVPASRVLPALLARDPGAATRQVLMLTPTDAMAHTGHATVAYAGHVAGPNFLCGANLMRQPGVPDAMAHAFRSAPDAPLGRKLLAALRGGQAAGGDLRGMQAAALLVVSGTAQPAWAAGVRVNLRVEDHPHPLDELARLLDLREAYDCLNASNAAWDRGDTVGARQLYAAMVEKAPENQELIFWCQAAPPPHRERLDPCWQELARRLSTD